MECLLWREPDHGNAWWLLPDRVRGRRSGSHYCKECRGCPTASRSGNVPCSQLNAGPRVGISDSKDWDLAPHEEVDTPLILCTGGQCHGPCEGGRKIPGGDARYEAHLLGTKTKRDGQGGWGEGVSQHGDGQHWYHKMGKVRDPQYSYCWDPKDDALHTFFRCEN